jgi:hypothetical protein
VVDLLVEMLLLEVELEVYDHLLKLLEEVKELVVEVLRKVH